jgi:phage pi2 protein 07
MSDSLRKWVEMQNDDRWTMDSTYKNNQIKKDPIVQRVISIMELRSKVGIDKYGTTLYDSPDGFYQFLNHLQEELMDAILYIEKLKSQK